MCYRKMVRSVIGMKLIGLLIRKRMVRKIKLVGRLIVSRCDWLLNWLLRV